MADSEAMSFYEESRRRLVAVGPVELSVIEWDRVGVGPSLTPFVLVHGLASNARMWDGVARRLEEAGHRAFAVDLRGHGRSGKPDSGYDMVTVADDVAALIEVLELDRPVVAGQSWGANVVVELAARHQRAVRGVVCVDGGFIELQSRFASWEDCWAALAPPRFAGTSRVQFEGWMAQAHADWPEEGQLGALANVEVRADDTVAPWLTFERHEQVLRGLWEHRPSERFFEVEAPLLWWIADSGEVAWTSDKQTAVERAMRVLRSSRVITKTAHHDVHAQHPDAVASSLVEATESGWM